MVHDDSIKDSNEFARENAVMELVILPGEFRGYYIQHAYTKWFRQAKDFGKIKNDRANLLLYTNAEILILAPPLLVR